MPDNGDNCYLKYSTLVNSGYADEELKELSSNTSLTDNNLKIEISKDKDYSKYTYAVEFKKDGFTDIPDKYCNARYEYTNLVKNGSFEDGLNEWIINGNDSNTTITVDIVDNKKVIKNTSASSSSYKSVKQEKYFLEGHTYYFVVKSLGNSNNTGTKRYSINNGDGTSTVSPSFVINPNVSTWTKGSNRFLVNSTHTPNQWINIGWGIMTGTVYIDDVMIVDLTEVFGPGKEPSKEWCDKYLDYVEYGSVENAFYK